MWDLDTNYIDHFPMPSGNNLPLFKEGCLVEGKIRPNGFDLQHDHFNTNYILDLNNFHVRD